MHSAWSSRRTYSWTCTSSTLLARPGVSTSFTTCDRLLTPRHFSAFYEVVSSSCYQPRSCPTHETNASATRARRTTKRTRRTSGSRATLVRLTAQMGMDDFYQTDAHDGGFRFRHHHHSLEPARHRAADPLSRREMALGQAHRQRSRKFFNPILHPACTQGSNLTPLLCRS